MGGGLVALVDLVDLFVCWLVALVVWFHLSFRLVGWTLDFFVFVGCLVVLDVLVG